MDNTQNVNNKNTNENANKIAILSYEQDKINMAFNILNSVQFTGIQQAQAIAQLAVILSNPIKNNNETN